MVYCSDNNPGAAQLMEEVALHISTSPAGRKGTHALSVMSDPNSVAACAVEHMLLLLTSRTWTRGDAATKALERS